MIPFPKDNTHNPEIPDWAPFFEKNEYNEFLKAIDLFFKQKNIEYYILDGCISFDGTSIPDGTFGLSNLAQTCKLAKIGDYQRIIFQHFEAMFKVDMKDMVLNKRMFDFEQIKESIGVRFYPLGYVNQLGAGMTISKKWAGDVAMMLVFDFKDSIMNVSGIHTKAWGKSEDELFEVGIKNIQGKYRQSLLKPPGDEFRVWFVAGEHYYNSNIVLELEKYPKLVGPYGTLIAMPHRHATIICPIHDIFIAKNIEVLLPTIYAMNAEGPGSISNHLFWYRNGEVEDLPYQVKQGKISFRPTPKFAALLETLNA